MVPLGRRSVAQIIQRDGTMLGTSRCPAFFEPEDRAKVVSPCGTSRELVSDYGDALVIYSVDSQVRKGRIGRLLPVKDDE
jgi:cytidine deaminase